MSASIYVDFVFDRPPGPDAPQLIGVVDADGNSVEAGKWIERPDARWVLRLDGTHMRDVLARLYDSGINCSLSSDIDGGWHAGIGTQPGGGFVMDTWVGTLDEAVAWLHQQARALFPQSEYARRYPL